MRGDHVAQLLEHAKLATEARLFIAAGRAVTQAEALAPRDGDVRAAQSALQQAIVAQNRDTERHEALESYLRSAECARARTAAEARRAKLEATVIDAYLALVDDAAADDADDGHAMRALRAAFAIDRDSKALRTRAGKERYAQLLQEHRERADIGHLRLGETVYGPDTDVQSLRGKVVLWRSFSL